MDRQHHTEQRGYAFAAFEFHKYRVDMSHDGDKAKNNLISQQFLGADHVEIIQK